MDRIQAIIFDFGRVLCDFDIHRFFRRAAAFSTLPPGALASLMNSATDVANRYETGLITSDEFYEAVCRLASLRMPKDEFVAAYTDIFTPIPASFELLRRLKPRYRLALLSNTSAWHFEHGIRPVAVFPLFDAVTLSYEVGAMKPDPRMYRDALRKLQLPASACAYIDDLRDNVEAGRALGLHALHYTSHEALVSDLRSLGIEQ